MTAILVPERRGLAGLALAAATQFGLVTRRQALSVGCSDKVLTRLCRTGELARVARGVYRWTAVPQSFEQEALTATLAVRGSALAGVSAMRLYGFDDPINATGRTKAAGCHVTTKTARAQLKSGAAVVHRARGLKGSHQVVRRGIAVTTPVRTLVDVASVVSDETLDRFVGHLLATRLLTPKALDQLNEKLQGSRSRGRAGAKALRRCLRRAGVLRVVDSQLEHRFLMLIRKAGLPEPKVRYVMRLGKLMFELDLAWPEAMVAVEVDGFLAHGGQAAFHHDRRRGNRIQAAGWCVYRVTSQEIEDGATEILGILAAALGRRPAIAGTVSAMRHAHPASGAVTLRVALDPSGGSDPARNGLNSPRRRSSRSFDRKFPLRSASNGRSSSRGRVRPPERQQHEPQVAGGWPHPGSRLWPRDQANLGLCRRPPVPERPRRRGGRSRIARPEDRERVSPGHGATVAASPGAAHRDPHRLPGRGARRDRLGRDPCSAHWRGTGDPAGRRHDRAGAAVTACEGEAWGAPRQPRDRHLRVIDRRLHPRGRCEAAERCGARHGPRKHRRHRTCRPDPRSRGRSRGADGRGGSCRDRRRRERRIRLRLRLRRELRVADTRPEGRNTSRFGGAGRARGAGPLPDLVAVGLGNPTPEFDGSRHNYGTMAVRLLAKRHGATLKAERLLRSETGLARLGDKSLLLAIPRTYMNESGQSVRPLWKRYIDKSDGQAPGDRLVIVHDELDLPPGTVRVKAGGGTAGNNGLKSIVAHLHRNDFLRVRIGIGKPPGRAQGVDHVLRRPGKAERELLEVAVEVAADAVEVILLEGVAVAMNRFNTKV